MRVGRSPTCRVCGSDRAAFVSAAVSGAPESKVYRCGECDLVYLFPIMTEEQEQAFYSSQFERYMEGRAGAGWQSPEAHFRAYQEEGERRLPLVRSYLQPEDSVLEIGSSTGFFLDDLRGYVREVTGVEPSEEYRRFAMARGIETVASLEELAARRFDGIFLYYVVEHLRDPVRHLARLRDFLNPGGRVFIEVPNVDDALVSLYAVPAFGPFYWQKAHYQNFSHRTLHNVLERAGYHAELIPAQRYDLSNHMVWMLEGKPGGLGRWRHIFGVETTTAYAEALKKHWLCDTIYAVAKVNHA